MDPVSPIKLQPGEVLLSSPEEPQQLQEPKLDPGEILLSGPNTALKKPIPEQQGPIPELQGPTQPRVQLAQQPSGQQKLANAQRLFGLPAPGEPITQAGMIKDQLMQPLRLAEKGLAKVGEAAKSVIQPIRKDVGEMLQSPYNQIANDPNAKFSRFLLTPMKSAGAVIAGTEDWNKVIPEEAQRMSSAYMGSKTSEWLSKQLNRPIPQGAIDLAKGLVADENLPFLFGMGMLGPTKFVAAKVANTALSMGFTAMQAEDLKGRTEAIYLAIQKGDWTTFKRLLIPEAGQIWLTAFGAMASVHGVKSLKAELPPTVASINATKEKFLNAIPEGKAQIPPVSDRGMSASEIRNPPPEPPKAPPTAQEPPKTPPEGGSPPQDERTAFGGRDPDDIPVDGPIADLFMKHGIDPHSMKHRGAWVDYNMGIETPFDAQFDAVNKEIGNLHDAAASGMTPEEAGIFFDNLAERAMTPEEAGIFFDNLAERAKKPGNWQSYNSYSKGLPKEFALDPQQVKNLGNELKALDAEYKKLRDSYLTGEWTPEDIQRANKRTDEMDARYKEITRLLNEDYKPPTPDVVDQLQLSELGIGGEAPKKGAPPTEEQQAELAKTQPLRGDWIPAVEMNDGTIHQGNPGEPHIDMVERLKLDVKQAKSTGWYNTKTGKYTTEIPSETVKEPGQIYEGPEKGTPQEKANQILGEEVVPGKYGEPIKKNPPADPHLQEEFNRQLGDLAGVEFMPDKPRDSLPIMLDKMKEIYNYKAPIRLFIGDVEVSRSEPNKFGGNDIHLAKDAQTPAALWHEFAHLAGIVDDSHQIDNNGLLQLFLNDNKPGTDLSAKFLPFDMDKLAAGAKSDWKYIQSAFAPVTRLSAKGKNVLSAFLGDRNWMQAQVRLDQTLKQMKRYFDKRDPQLNLDEMDQVRSGDLSQIKDPISRAYHEMWREISDKQWKVLNDIKDLPYLPNYEQLVWKIPPKNPDILRELSPGMAKTPLQGSQRWNNRRMYEYISEGMKDGGVPISTNPVDLFNIQWMDVTRFLSARKMLDSAKEAGTAIFVRDGAEHSAPAGWRPIKDPLADAWTWEEGRHIRNGRYFFDPVMATALDNFLSTDYVRKFAIGRDALAYKNLVTQMELGWNAFHGMFITNEAMASRVGHGLLSIGNQGVGGLIRDALDRGAGRSIQAPLAPLKAVVEGVRTIIGAPKTGPAEAFIKGSDFVKYLQNPTEFSKSLKGQGLDKFAKDNDFDSIEEARKLLFKSNSPVGQSMEYRTRMLAGFVDSLEKGNFAGAILKSYPALVEQVSRPLFEIYIPQAKYAMYFHEFAARMKYADMTWGEGVIPRETIARWAQRSVEDRFGEMSFDQFFWNNTFKSSMQFLVRSITWRLGSLHQVGQAVRTQAAEVARLWHDGYLPEWGYEAGTPQSQKSLVPRLTPDMAWLLGQIIVHGTYTAILGYALTGKWPQKLEDWFFAPTGYQDRTGHEIKLSPATYGSQYWYMTHDPWEYLIGGASTAIRPLKSLAEGHNYYGEKVGMDDPLSVFKEMIPIPFSYQAYSRLVDQGVPPEKAALAWVGFSKTPGYLDKTPMEKALEDSIDTSTGRPLEDSFRAAVGSKVKGAVRYGTPEFVKEQLDKLSKADIAAGKQKQILRDAFKYSQYSYIAAHSDIRKVLDAMEQATPEELYKLGPTVLKRMGASLKAVQGQDNEKEVKDKWDAFVKRYDEVRKSML